jgi:hypothetical protein
VEAQSKKYGCVNQDRVAPSAACEAPSLDFGKCTCQIHDPSARSSEDERPPQAVGRAENPESAETTVGATDGVHPAASLPEEVVAHQFTPQLFGAGHSTDKVLLAPCAQEAEPADTDAWRRAVPGQAVSSAVAERASGQPAVGCKRSLSAAVTSCAGSREKRTRQVEEDAVAFQNDLAVSAFEGAHAQHLANEVVLESAFEKEEAAGQNKMVANGVQNEDEDALAEHRSAMEALRRLEPPVVCAKSRNHPVRARASVCSLCRVCAPASA